jgi:capsular exopolysaccharide synthesis family protein
MLNPLLDAPVASTAPVMAVQPSPASGAAPPPNLLFGVLRRWPWLLLGVAAGLVLGLLYHMQSAPVYQSTAQLLVIKNRPELTSSGGSDARVQFVEDYVATQVLYLKSERILKQTAKQLDNYKPFQVEPPVSEVEKIAFLGKRFNVMREKEPGTNTMSNIVQLTFKSPHPADSPKYLKAIIEAYKGDLGAVYEGASITQLEGLQRDIDALNRNIGVMDEKLKQLGLELRGQPGTVHAGISQEELTSVRARISANRNAEQTLRLREIAIAGELDTINKAGSARATRRAVMDRLGIPSDRSWLVGPDSRDLEGTLNFLKMKRAELSTKYGPGHPDMVALNRQIDLLEKEIADRGGPSNDELDRYRIKLENERDAILRQLGVLQKEISADELKATRMSELQRQIDALQADKQRDEGRRRDQERERDRIAATKSVGGYKVEDVTEPTEGMQIAPVLVQSLLLGAVAGLLMGIGLGLWAELADRSFRSPLDIRRHLGLPVLGHVPPIRTNDPPEYSPVTALDPVLAVILRPHSAEAEAVRGIRTQLLFSTSGNEHQVLQVTSPNPGDGKSTLSANLAISLAKSNKRVVLVDCDFRKPRIHRMFALPNPELGLASVVADQADLGAVIQGCEIENLSLLPCGPRPANPAELLTTPKFQEMLDDLRANYDFVILDTPPVLAVSDPAAVAPRADGVILVFRMTKDARPAAERALDDLTAVGGRILGVVVNGSTEREMGYGYGHSYRYGYQYTDSYADSKS